MLLRDAYTCQECGEFGDEVDHIDGDASHNPPDGSNWQTLCESCHATKTALETGVSVLLPRVARARIPVTLIAGPPAAGKTTYIRERADPNDIVIDLDAIATELKTQSLPALLAERNRRLKALASESEAAKCWFVSMAPTQHERRYWAENLGAERVVLEVSADECLRRAMADPKRKGKPAEFWQRIIHRWWKRYVKSAQGEETVLHPGANGQWAKA